MNDIFACIQRIQIQYNNISESCPFGCNGYLDLHLLSFSAVMTVSVSSLLRVVMGAEFIDC